MFRSAHRVIKSKSKRPRTSKRKLEYGVLENRRAMVVGAFAVPAAVPPGGPYDGVVTIGNCTGSLLYSGRHILTAAHCIGGDAKWVRFDLQRGATPISIQLDVPAGGPFQTIHPGWTGVNRQGHDLAIMRLVDQVPGYQDSWRHLVAPFGAQRYELYRTSDEIGQPYTFVGYGNAGVGSTGVQPGLGGVKRTGRNHFSNNGSGWFDTDPNLGIFSDFDDGSSSHNYYDDPYWQGNLEASVANGDSGGPAFLGNKIAGVAAMGADVNSDNPYWSFGDLFGWTRVSAFQTWIDDRVSGAYHLVLDMNYQVLGRDQLIENVTITARTNNENLELWVSAPAFSGLYYSAPLYSIGSLTIRGSSDHETFNIEPGLGLNVTLDGRSGNDVFNLKGVAPNRTLTITGNNGNDTFNLGNNNSVATIQGTIKIEGGAGIDSLNYYDGANTGNDGYVVESTYMRRLGTGLSFYATLEKANLFAGAGSNLIDVRATNLQADYVVFANAGNDSLRISPQSRNLTRIGGSVTAYAGSGNDSISFHDQEATTNETYVLDGSAGLFTFRRPSMSSVSFTGFNLGTTINGAAGNSHFDLKRTPTFPLTLHAGPGDNNLVAANVSGPLTINAGDGNDVVELVLGNAATVTNMVLNAGNGANDKLILNDLAYTANANYVLSAGPTFTRSGLGNIQFNGFNGGTRIYGGKGTSNLNVYDSAPWLVEWITGKGDNTVNVWQTLGPFRVWNRDGLDTIRLGAGGTLAQIQGAIEIAGNIGASTDLIIRDSDNEVPTSSQLTNGGVVGLAPFPITWDEQFLVGLTIYSGGGADLMTVQSLPANANPEGLLTKLYQGDGNDHTELLTTQPELTLYGGEGTNSLRGPNQPSEWQIMGGNRGFRNFNLAFFHIADLQGGTANDSYFLAEDGGLSGHLTDLGGVDQLDYSQRTSDVSISLKDSTATSIRLGVSNLENVIGGFGNDLLRGDDFANVLEGGEGQDILLGFGGNDVLRGGNGRDFLIGGTGADLIYGGGDEDILFDGTTAYDLNDAVLKLLLQQWADESASYETRILNLRGSLTSDTVSFDNSIDSLFGQGWRDWFWAFPGSDTPGDILDRNLANEILN